jgi:PPK2 family polyphosphate:nucleotide phosphotransferase
MRSPSDSSAAESSFRRSRVVGWAGATPAHDFEPGTPDQSSIMARQAPELDRAAPDFWLRLDCKSDGVSGRTSPSRCMCWDGAVVTSLVVRPGTPVDLTRRDPDSTPSAPGGRAETEAAFEDQHLRLADLQERLFAEGTRELLVVLQAIDTAGKDGTIRHVFRGFNPSGTRVATFREPTELEAAHDFLWRVHSQVPRAGEVVVFNRSHYEDVLVTRVHGLVPPHVVRARYEHINAFERLLHDDGTQIVKFLLHISYDEQGKRLEERRRDPSKRWKFKESDLAERTHWDDYQAAFTAMLEATSTEHALWHVIPANHKWYRNWAVTEILLRLLEDMNPRYPTAAR